MTEREYQIDLLTREANHLLLDLEGDHYCWPILRDLGGRLLEFCDAEEPAESQEYSARIQILHSTQAR